MTDVFTDIETIPSQRDDVKTWCRERAENEAREGETRAQAFDRIWRATSLDGGFGEVIAIGAALDDRPVKTWKRRLGESEADMLSSFFNEVGRVSRWCLVGHNVTEFDRRFLLQRSMVLGVAPPPIIFSEVKPWEHDRIFDTMATWTQERGRYGKVKLAVLAFALGIIPAPVKGDVDGSMVWDMVELGMIDDVERYVGKDVDLVRKVANRMRWRT